MNEGEERAFVEIWTLCSLMTMLFILGEMGSVNIKFGIHADNVQQ